MQELSTREKLADDLSKVHQGFLEKVSSRGGTLVPVAGTEQDGVVLYQEIPSIFKGRYAHLSNPQLAYALMKACRENPLSAHDLVGDPLKKASINVASNIFGYDLRAPSIHLIPFLSPIRDETARVQHSQPGDAAHWKTISVSGLNTGGFLACPWINEGQRAPLLTITAVTNTAPYATIGIDGSDTYEAQSAGMDFEDPLSTARFLGLESLMVKEEDSLLGGNKTLKLGTANTPTGAATGSGSLTGIYAAVVGLTYEGFRNQSVTAGLVQQMNLMTPDNKAMQVNGGMGIASAVSSTTGSSSASVTFTVVAKVGELAWAWYAGTSNSTASMYLQAITTVPSLTLTATPVTTTQKLSTLAATDYSVNDGTTGGGAQQVTGFDGFLTQALNASQLATPNAYYKELAGATLTASGAGSIVEIDTALAYAWNNFRITYDEIWVNAQELKNITAKCLSNASGPLLRYDVAGDGGMYDLVASGVISFYFNPYMPNGGKKIPVRIHPTLPPGTIFLKGNTLPPFFKKSNMTTGAEVICRRDYYSIDWANTTREYQFGVYAEEVLAVYAPFLLGVLTGIAN